VIRISKALIIVMVSGMFLFLLTGCVVRVTEQTVQVEKERTLRLIELQYQEFEVSCYGINYSNGLMEPYSYEGFLDIKKSQPLERYEDNERTIKFPDFHINLYPPFTREINLEEGSCRIYDLLRFKVIESGLEYNDTCILNYQDCDSRVDCGVVERCFAR
jgi:hypothetical protein